MPGGARFGAARGAALGAPLPPPLGMSRLISLLVSLSVSLLVSPLASRFALVGIVVWQIAPAHAELAPAPSREVASKCRALAYRVYPRERPGHAPGSGARYELFRDCVDRGGNIDPATSPAMQFKPPPAPHLGPPPDTRPASSQTSPEPALPQP